MQRLRQLDVIRGFAVLGLFIMNAPYFGLFDWGYVPQEGASPLDNGLIAFNSIFIDGRFRTLFCLLFGCAIGIQYQKYGAKDKINHRNRTILVIGAIHGICLWAGDILFVYGLAGLLLVSYVENDGKTNIRQGMILLCVMTTLLVIVTAFEPMVIPNRQSQEFIEVYNATFNSALSPWVSNFKNFLAMLILTPFLTLWYTLALMRIGLGAWQQGWFHKGLPQSVVILVAIAAFMLSALTLIFKFSNKATLIGISEAINWLAAVAFSGLYAHVLIKLSQKQTFISDCLGATGKIALTLYLLQSVIGVLLFRVFFPSWSLEFDMVHYSFLSLIVAILCIVFSTVYLRMFRQGPMEWLLARWLQRAKI